MENNFSGNYEKNNTGIRRLVNETIILATQLICLLEHILFFLTLSFEKNETP